MVIGVIINFVLSLWIIPQYVGAKRKIGFWWSLVACVFLTPFVGGIITVLSPKLEEQKTENIKKLKEEKRAKTQQDEKLESLKSLKNDGILTETEYHNKVEILEKEKADLEEKKIFEELKKQDSYKKLKSLFDSGVLTNEEFDSKVKTLINSFKDVYSNKKKLTGKWYYDKSVLIFNPNYNFKFYNNYYNSKNYLAGKWDVLDKNTIQLYYGNKQHNLKLIDLTDNFLNYEQNGRNFKFQKPSR